MELNNMDHHSNASTSMKVILFLFALVLVGSLGYFVYQQNTAADTTDYSAPKTTVKKSVAVDTSSWKTLVNTTLNLSVKYPSDWTVSGKANTDPTTFDAPAWSSTCNYDNGDTCLQMVIGTDATAWTGTLASYVTNYLKLNSAEAAVQSNTTIGGLPAIKAVLPKVAGDPATTAYRVIVFTLRNDVGFMVQFDEQTMTSNAGKITGFKNTAILDAVIASIKFTS